MSQRRASKRSFTITNKRLSEERLERKKVEAEIRVAKHRSKLLQNLHKAKLTSYQEEAQRLSDIVDSLSLASGSDSNLSGDSLEITVNEIIDNINSLADTPTETILDSSDSSRSTRRRQTTDPDLWYISWCLPKFAS